jgi:hypothetical protein
VLVEISQIIQEMGVLFRGKGSRKKSPLGLWFGTALCCEGDRRRLAAEGSVLILV